MGWGYCIQINKKGRFMVYSWIKETGLANLGRGRLCRSTVFRLQISNKRELCQSFSAHTVNIYSWTRGTLCCVCLWDSPQRDCLAIPLWGSGPWQGQLMSTTHTHSCCHSSAFSAPYSRLGWHHPLVCQYMSYLDWIDIYSYLAHKSHPIGKNRRAMDTTPYEKVWWIR